MMNDRQFAGVTTYSSRPPFQGSTLHTWIGFKRFMYLVEEAVLEYFRARNCGPHRLYHEYGLCFEIVNSSIRIFHPLTVDDVVTAEVWSDQEATEGELTLKVRFFIERDDKKRKPLSGKVTVLLRRAGNGIAEKGLPAALAPYICDKIDRRPQITAETIAALEPGDTNSDDAIQKRLVPPGANAFVSKQHIPYYYCHYGDRIQHSGYIAFLESVVPLFLADRGISIRTMLKPHGWIPVVSQAQVEILREAVMEEPIYIVYTVEELFKELTYTARMDCYVPRNNSLCHTATGRIVHGYAQVQDRQNWGLAQFDSAVLSALRGEKI